MFENKRIAFFIFAILLLSSFAFSEIIRENSIKLFAVSDNGKGIPANLKIKISDGSGEIWSKISSLLGLSTQNTEKTVVQLAKNYFKDINKYDYSFEIESNASIIDGPSAGLPMAILLITMLKGKDIPDYVSATGTINSKGFVGPIGGVLEKTKTAASTGIKLFFVPRSNLDIVIKEGKKIIKTNLPKYAYEKYNIKVVGVDTIDDALSYLNKKYEDIKINDTNSFEDLPVYNPKESYFSEHLNDFHKFIKNYYNDTVEKVKDAKRSLNNANIEQDLLNDLFAVIVNSEKLLEDANAALSKKYLYSSANYVFLAKVYSSYVKDLAKNPNLLKRDYFIKEKSKELKASLIELENSLKYLPIENYDWYIGARQRFLWASYYLKNIESSIAVKKTDISEKIIEYEFAKEWIEIAKSFIKNKDTTEYLDNSAYKLSAKKAIDEISDINIDDPELKRRSFSANEAYLKGWYIASLYESAAILANLNVKSRTKDIDYENLKKTVYTNISNAEKEVKEIGGKLVWIELYLQHSKYLFGEAEFYEDNNNLTLALNSLINSYELIMYTSNLLKVAKSYKDALVIKKETKAKDKKVIEKDIEYITIFLLIISLIVLILIIVLIIINIRNIKEKYKEMDAISDIDIRIRKLNSELKKLNNIFLKNKIKKEQYEEKYRKISEEIMHLEEKKQDILSEIKELKKLEESLNDYNRDLKQLARQYSIGKIDKKEYKKKINDLKKKSKRIKKKINKEKESIERGKG